MDSVKLYSIISTYGSGDLASQSITLFKKSETLTKIGDAKIRIASACETINDSGAEKSSISASFSAMSGRLSNASIGLRISTSRLAAEDYLFSPAALYNGNKFKAVNQKYPPFLHDEDDISADMQTTITDVPRVNSDLTGTVDLLSGDMATPCIGIFQDSQKHGILIYSKHNSKMGYIGYKFFSDRNNSYIEISYPGVREKAYTMMNSAALCTDKGFNFESGDSAAAECVIYEFECADINQFYKMFFKTRYTMEHRSEFINQLSFSSAFGLLQDKTRLDMWDSANEYLRITPNGEGLYGDWQAGWVGGGINAFALSVDGDKDLSQKADKTFSTIYGKLQNQNGFIYPIMSGGKLYGDDFCHLQRKEILLLRKNADVLSVSAKYILHKGKRGIEVPAAVMSGALKLAGCFVNLFEKYGQIGQFVDMENATILIGKTASASMAVGALALIYEITNDKVYLKTATELATLYIDENLGKGLINGGPGEIAQCPDSESTFALLESLVTLFEVTGEERWLKSAIDCAYQASSWCMTYDFDFPQGSEFYRLDMKTTGSVFANVQNKHSAPAICTLSPVSLFKLYFITKDIAFLRLCKEIAFNNMQYFSRNDRIINSWDGEPLPSGWMCERVNTSDWEGKKGIGGVFKASCWCEISAMLTYVEVPSIYISDDFYFVLDHVSVNKIDSSTYELTNDTDFDSEYKIFVDNLEKESRILGECYLENCYRVKIKSKEKLLWQVH